MRWLRALGLGLVVVLGLGSGAAARAEPIAVEVMVSRISNAPGGVDPRAAALDRQLRREFRYESLEVLETRTLRLDEGEVGSLRLPNGKELRVRPLQRDAESVLLAVQAGSLQTDVRVNKGRLVVIGAEREGDGKTVISVRPRW